MPPPQVTLTTEVKYLKGVGPARAELLASRGIRTVEDLLYYTPFRYEDRTHLTAIDDLIPGQTATILATVLTCGLMRTRRGLYIYDLAAVDASGAAHPRMFRCKWFNASYLERNKVFCKGQRVFFYGKVERDPYGTGNLQMIQPQFEILPEGETAEKESLEVGRVVPIYESMGQIGPRVLRRLMRAALESLGERDPGTSAAFGADQKPPGGSLRRFPFEPFPGRRPILRGSGALSNPSADSADFRRVL